MLNWFKKLIRNEVEAEFTSQEHHFRLIVAAKVKETLHIQEHVGKAVLELLQDTHEKRYYSFEQHNTAHGRMVETIASKLNSRIDKLATEKANEMVNGDKFLAEIVARLNAVQVPKPK